MKRGRFEKEIVAQSMKTFSTRYSTGITGISTTVFITARHEASLWFNGNQST